MLGGSAEMDWISLAEETKVSGVGWGGEACIALQVVISFQNSQLQAGTQPLPPNTDQRFGVISIHNLLPNVSL